MLVLRSVECDLILRSKVLCLIDRAEEKRLMLVHAGPSPSESKEVLLLPDSGVSGFPAGTINLENSRILIKSRQVIIAIINPSPFWSFVVGSKTAKPSSCWKSCLTDSCIGRTIRVSPSAVYQDPASPVTERRSPVDSSGHSRRSDTLATWASPHEIRQTICSRSCIQESSPIKAFSPVAQSSELRLFFSDRGGSSCKKGMRSLQARRLRSGARKSH